MALNTVQESNFINNIKRKLIDAGGIQPKEFDGCTEDEIKNVMRHQGVSYLPKIYHDFLMVMGRSAGYLYSGTDAFYPRLENLKENVQYILDDSGARFQLPEDAFIMWVHQDYELIYFLTESSNNDPAVYIFTEGMETPSILSDTLSDFFEKTVDEFIAYHKQ